MNEKRLFFQFQRSAFHARVYQVRIYGLLISSSRSHPLSDQPFEKMSDVRNPGIASLRGNDATTITRQSVCEVYN
jgi:hypothetical protein